MLRTERLEMDLAPALVDTLSRPRKPRSNPKRRRFLQLGDTTAKVKEGSGKVNKSQAIRDLFAEDPKMDSKTVMARLAEKNIKVSPAMVYFVRSKLKLAKRRARRDKVAVSSAPLSRNPAELVLRVKALAREVGGMENLKQLVDVLAE